MNDDLLKHRDRFTGCDKTHDGHIITDDGGYVWLSCEHYNLPDTTHGKIGYHVVYRPLCGSMYEGNELITDAIKEDIKAHYEEIKTRKEVERKANLEAMLKRLQEPQRVSPMDKMICKKCGTVCYGDCEF